MLNDYLPVLVFLVLGLVIGGVFTFGNVLVGPKRPRGWTPTKQAQEDPYECGLPSEVKERFRFGISFYLIAMLFILFDVEVLFLYPVAVQLKAFGLFAVIETITFSILLLIGFIYSWRRGALDWRL